jgi:hypothetical protein
MTTRLDLLAAVCAAGFVVLVPLSEGAGATPGAIVDPLYEWSFEKFLSNGVGGVQLPPEAAELPGEQFGGELSENAFLGFSGSPNMEVFSNAAGTTFWASARSPVGNPELLDVPLGARSTLTLTQTFQVEEPAATLSFTISQIALDAFEPGQGLPGRDGLSAYLSFDVMALDQAGDPFFYFLDETSLTGEGGAWDLDDLSGPLVTQIVLGGENLSSLNARLAAPFTQAIDLSSLHVRDIFTVRYTIVAEAIDTEQYESRISAFARDPLNPGNGNFFEYSGLTPIATIVPEPGTLLLVLSGLGGLASFRARRGPAAPLREA